MERLVCLLQIEDLYLGVNPGVVGEFKQFSAVLAGAIGYAADGSFMVEQRIVHLRDGAHGDSSQCKCATLSQGAERVGHECASRSKNDRRIERVGRSVFRGAHPNRTEFPRQVVMSLCTRENVDFAAFVAGELQNQMGGRPKAIQAETSARVSPAQAVGTISDYSCAQQRRGIFVGELVRNGMGEGFVDKDELSIAAVHVIPGKLGVVTEVFEAAPAMIAPSFSTRTSAPNASTFPTI